MNMERDNIETIAWHKWATDDRAGYGKIDGVNIWTRGPDEDIDDWRWEATRWNGDYPGGCPRQVNGIGHIDGRADSEAQAVEMAYQAAKLIGMMPGDLAPIVYAVDAPIPYCVVAVADGPDEKVEVEG
jgi:hypothetical protein